MKKENILSLRLGFSCAQAAEINRKGVEKFLLDSFEAPYNQELPLFLADAPRTIAEFRAMRREQKTQNQAEIDKSLKKMVGLNHQLAGWWLSEMYQSEKPLREKMVLFWHNHFVSTRQKVKVPYLLYEQNQLFREYAFGNFKTLTKKILKNNAMILFLDNHQNKAKALNENLSRELLELFTLGIGNYTEQDLKEGAKALAGLLPDEEEGRYYKIFEDNSMKTYLGKKGNLKADDLVEAIFEQPTIPYLLTEKFLKFFLTDTPSAASIKYYADFFKKQNYEIRPLIVELFTKEDFTKYNGFKIKDPLLFLIQTFKELGFEKPLKVPAIQFLRSQGMELFNPPNVKGWAGGRDWLSTDRLLQRFSSIDALVYGKFSKKKFKAAEEMDEYQESEAPTIRISWNKKATTNREIIKELSERLLFQVDNDMQNSLERILPYDYQPAMADHIEPVIQRLMVQIMKSAEYQIF